jgi:hypothetical protein
LFCFEVIGKSGFKSTDKVISIFDTDNSIFYYKENESKKNIKFNLPKGIYFTKNNLEIIAPIKYKFSKLSKTYNETKTPESFIISYGNNPHKCTVDLNKGTIFFDNRYKSAERYTIDYIIFHELGHYFYYGKGQKSEIDCDKFAANCMLSLGYNPSQIRAAQFYTLSENEEAKERKKEIYNLTQNSYE